MAHPGLAHLGLVSLRIGFATVWARPAPPTWSYTPWSLRSALEHETEVVDLSLPEHQLAALRLLHLRSLRGNFRSLWRISPAFFGWAGRSYGLGAKRNGCDVVLEVTPTGRVRDVPYFVYHDTCLDALEPYRDPHTGAYPYLPPLSSRVLERFREREGKVFREAEAVFAMSHWMAASLTSRTGVDPARVHVVHPGCNALASVDLGQARATRDRRNRLLFVGKAFHAKGGDLVVEALRILRHSVDPSITLTIAGPRALPFDVPEGVRFLGQIPLDDVIGLYQEHDLFVMPSRLEPFGIVFVEALAHGLPCVGRDAFEMPVLIKPGRSGDLVSNDDPNALAAAIARVLTDDSIYEHCEMQRSSVMEHYSWRRAAREMIAVMSDDPVRRGSA